MKAIVASRTHLSVVRNAGSADLCNAIRAVTHVLLARVAFQVESSVTTLALVGAV